MRSMTGCGRGQLMRDKTEMTLELKCVNHRFLDIACRLPRQLSFLEEPLRRGISQALHRGHVDVFVNYQNLRQDARPLAPLRVAVRGEGGVEIYAWVSPAPKPALGPGESAPFRARLVAPPKSGRDVQVRFAER